jgi:hypothetical protein
MHEKESALVLAQTRSERARVRGLCKVSPPAVLVRRQPFINPKSDGFSVTML